MIKYVVLLLLFVCSCSAYGFFFDRQSETDKRRKRSLLLSKKMEKEVELAGEKLAKRRNVKFLLNGRGGLVQCDYVLYSLAFMSYEACERSAAREQAKSLMMEWWSMILANPIYTQYFDDMTALPAYKDYDLHPRRFGIKLSFWDENMDRRPEPYISQVKVCDGKIYYYYRRKDGEALQEPLVETFEEAGWKFEGVPFVPANIEKIK